MEEFQSGGLSTSSSPAAAAAAAAVVSAEYTPPTLGDTNGTRVVDYSYEERNDNSCMLEIVRSMEDVLDEPPLILLPYTGMMSGILYTIKTLGFFALYFGLTPTLLGSIPKAGIRFGVFSWMSNLLQDEDGDTSTAATFMAGSRRVSVRHCLS